MSPQPAGLSFVTSIVDGTGGEVLDVLGPAVEFLYVSEGPYEQFCLMRGVVPPGVTVPLHSHDDMEAFFMCPVLRRYWCREATVSNGDRRAPGMTRLPEALRMRSVLPLLDAYRRPERPSRGGLDPGDAFQTAVHEAGIVSANDTPQVSPALIHKYAADLRGLGLI
jgi:hypothetical protein